MSDELTLSQDLISKVLDYLKENDPRCDNELIACQYLSAVIGFVISKQSISAEEKEDILGELMAFSKHVMGSMAPQDQAESAPPTGEAFGVWKPDS